MTKAEFKAAHSTHSYQRSHYTKDGKTMIWKCTHPMCTHTLNVPVKNRRILIGRASLCPKCMQNTFVISQVDAKLKTPHCSGCKEGAGGVKTSDSREKVKSVIEKLLDGGGLIFADSPKYVVERDREENEDDN